MSKKNNGYDQALTVAITKIADNTEATARAVEVVTQSQVRTEANIGSIRTDLLRVLKWIALVALCLAAALVGYGGRDAIKLLVGG